MPREYSTTPPELAREITIRAIERFHEAKEQYERYEPFDDDIAWTTASDYNHATDALVVALLARPAEGDPFVTCPADKREIHVKPRGFAHEGVLYLAAITEADAADQKFGERDVQNCWVMQLVTVELALIVGLGREV